MGDFGLHKKHHIESEMDRFEKEISSLGPTQMASRAFIPAQLRRGPLNTGGAAIPPPPPPAQVVKPSPIIISGAPQVYTAPGTSTTTLAAPPKLNNAPDSSMISKPSSTVTSSSVTSVPSASSSSGAVVKPLEAPKTVKKSDKSKDKKKKKKKKKDDEKKPKKLLRSAGGTVWEDLTLQDWDPNDFRLFCGDLGNDVTDEVLTRVFGRYPTFQKAKVVRDKRTNKTKGYGFVAFKDPQDFARALREWDGRYVGSRPIKLRKSNWRSRNLDEARKREKERNQIMSFVKK